MKNTPYISQRTRDAAERAISDLSTDVLLDAMRQMPLSDFRRKELDESYKKDLAEHRKVYRMEEEEKAPREADPVNPARMLAAMTYSKAPQGEAGGELSAPRARQGSQAPLQGDSLGAYKVAKPKPPESDAPVYAGFKIDGSAGDGAAQSEVG